jgi:hypothetical protein
MSSKFFGRTAVGIAAATATLLIATPGIASADVGDAPRDGGKETPSWDAKELKKHGINIVCINKEEQKKRHHKGMRAPIASGSESGSDSVGWPANGADGGGSEESKGYDKRKKHDSNTNKQDAEQANVNVSLICGDENDVEQGGSNNSQNTQGKSLGVQANDNEVDVELGLHRNAAGELSGLSLRAPDGAVEGGFGGETAPNAGLAFGGAGALAAAALGTVLIRRRTADETVA